MNNNLSAKNVFKKQLLKTVDKMVM